MLIRSRLIPSTSIRCYSTKPRSRNSATTRELLSAVKSAISGKPSKVVTLHNQFEALTKIDPELCHIKENWDKSFPDRSLSEFISHFPVQVNTALQLAKWMKLNPGERKRKFLETHKPNYKLGRLTKKTRIPLLKALEDDLLSAKIGFHKPRSRVPPSLGKGSSSPSISASTPPPVYQYFRSPEHVLAFQNLTTQVVEGSLDTTPTYEPIKVEQTSEVPTLKHDLSRVLFSPGVHFLQDPRTKVFNFDPYLKNILPVNEFDFQHITQYVASEKDKTMLKVSKLINTRYYSSTSSMTGILSHLHYLLSNFRPVNLKDLSRNVRYSHVGFSRGAKLPGNVIVRKMEQSDGETRYAIDSDKYADKEMILSRLGHSLERLLTNESEIFDKYKLSNKSEENSKAQLEMEKNSNAYHYAKMDKFLMRSQLDCKDERLPGTGTFDLKSRAVCAIRHDVAFHEEETTGYELLKTVGEYESFEKEMSELARSTLLKYSLQARIGNMDGIFLAFHNIAKMFGFQYLPSSEMDKMIHSFGKKPLKINERTFDLETLRKYELQDKLSSKFAQDEFTISMKFYEKILDVITNDYLPNTSFRLVVKAVPQTINETCLIVIAHPVTDKEIDEIQTAGMKYSEAITETAGIIENDESIDEETKTQKNKDKERVSKHVDKLRDLNDKVYKNAHGFSIWIDQKINEKRILTRHPTYQSLNDDWNVDFKIEKLNDDETRENYLNFMDEKCKLLLEHGYSKDDGELTNYVKLLRAFSERGKKRALEEDNDKIIWNKD